MGDITARIRGELMVPVRDKWSVLQSLHFSPSCMCNSIASFLVVFRSALSAVDKSDKRWGYSSVHSFPSSPTPSLWAIRSIRAASLADCVLKDGLKDALPNIDCLQASDPNKSRPRVKYVTQSVLLFSHMRSSFLRSEDQKSVDRTFIWCFSN